MRVKAWVFIYPIPMVIACWYALSRIFGMRNIFWQLSLIVASYLFCLALYVAAWTFKAQVWTYVGLAALAGLLVPTAAIQERFSLPPLPQSLADVVGMIIFWWPSTALIVAGLLMYSGLGFYVRNKPAETEAGRVTQGQLKLSSRLAAVNLALSGLIIAKLMHNLYWLMVWDNTNDSLENIWLILPILAALLSGYLLLVRLPGWSKLAGPAYTAMTVALMLAVSARGQQVDFRQLTEARAEKVTRAVEAYAAREGHFPERLSQLIPRYALALPGAVIIYGQGWCYDGGDNYYRLGYIDREHWSSPYLEGHMVQSAGETADLPPLCGKEILDFIKRRPDRFIVEGK